MDFDLQHTVLKHVAGDSIENSISLGLIGRRDERDNMEDGGVQQCWEPPEHTQFKAQRIFLSLCIQIIARFFVSETIPAYVTDEPRERDDSNIEGLFNSCCRSEMISRIRSFRSSGSDALFALTIVKNDGQVFLTAADKQFALWTLREVCVAAFEAEFCEGSGLMIWCEYFVYVPIYFQTHHTPLFFSIPVFSMQQGRGYFTAPFFATQAAQRLLERERQESPRALRSDNRRGQRLLRRPPKRQLGVRADLPAGGSSVAVCLP